MAILGNTIVKGQLKALSDISTNTLTVGGGVTINKDGIQIADSFSNCKLSKNALSFTGTSNISATNISGLASLTGYGLTVNGSASLPPNTTIASDHPRVFKKCTSGTTIMISIKNSYGRASGSTGPGPGDSIIFTIYKQAYGSTHSGELAFEYRKDIIQYPPAGSGASYVISSSSVTVDSSNNMIITLKVNGTLSDTMWIGIEYTVGITTVSVS